MSDTNYIDPAHGLTGVCNRQHVSGVLRDAAEWHRRRAALLDALAVAAEKMEGPGEEMLWHFAIESRVRS